MTAVRKLPPFVEEETSQVASSPICVLESAESNEVIRLVHEKKTRNVVQQKGLAYESELKFAETVTKNPDAYLDDPIGHIFGLESDRQSRVAFAMSFSASTKKSQLLTALGDFVAQVPGSRTIWDQALLTADEIYTNASKNAWPEGHKLFDGAPTREGTIEFFAEADGQRLLIGCRDSFGDLDLAHVVGRIWECFAKGVSNSIRFGTGGAGIGSFMIFEGCCGYYAGVEPGKRSVVCIALPLGLSRRAGAELPKNIHLVYKQE